MSVWFAVKRTKLAMIKSRRTKKKLANRKWEQSRRYKSTENKELQFFIRRMKHFPIWNISSKTTVLQLIYRFPLMDE